MNAADYVFSVRSLLNRSSTKSKDGDVDDVKREFIVAALYLWLFPAEIILLLQDFAGYLGRLGLLWSLGFIRRVGSSFFGLLPLFLGHVRNGVFIFLPLIAGFVETISFFQLLLPLGLFSFFLFLGELFLLHLLFVMSVNHFSG